MVISITRFIVVTAAACLLIALIITIYHDAQKQLDQYARKFNYKYRKLQNENQKLRQALEAAEKTIEEQEEIITEYSGAKALFSCLNEEVDNIA